jgi:predicted transcriptional regulator
MAKTNQIGLRLDDDSYNKLMIIAKERKWSRAKVVSGALLEYQSKDSDQSGKDAVAELTAKLDALAADHEALKKELNQVKTLIIEIIEKLQEKGR